MSSLVSLPDFGANKIPANAPSAAPIPISLALSFLLFLTILYLNSFNISISPFNFIFL